MTGETLSLLLSDIAFLCCGMTLGISLARRYLRPKQVNVNLVFMGRPGDLDEEDLEEAVENSLGSSDAPSQLKKQVLTELRRQLQELQRRQEVSADE